MNQKKNGSNEDDETKQQTTSQASEISCEYLLQSREDKHDTLSSLQPSQLLIIRNQKNVPNISLRMSQCVHV